MKKLITLTAQGVALCSIYKRLSAFVRDNTGFSLKGKYILNPMRCIGQLITLLILALALQSCGDKAQKNVPEYNNRYNGGVLDSILQNKNYISGKKYEPLSLHYQGKPLAIIGKNADTLKATDFSFRGDPNLEFQGYFGLISDCLSMDNNLQIAMDDNQSINGIIFFSVIEKNREIFTFSGSWTIDTEVNSSTKKMIADSITTKLFPKLKNKLKIEDGWNYSIESNDFIETFEIIAPKENNVFFWHLSYDVDLKKKE